MRVLLIESMKGLGSEVSDLLRSGGHDVASCFDGLESVPCVGVDDPAACPLEGGVDVAVLVRDPTLSRPSLQEMGAMCAMRHKVPLVEAYPTRHSPYEDRAAAGGPDLLGDVEAAYQDGLARFGEVVRTAIVGLPQLAGVDAAGVRVDVARERGRVLVTLHLPGGLERSAVESAVTWATRAAREYDDDVTVIDVAVVEEASST